MINRLLTMVAIIAVIMLIPLSAQCDEWQYTVKPGDNLWTLTEKYLPNLSYVKKLQAYNSLQNPYRIPPGSIVRIPLNWLKSSLSSAQVVVIGGKTVSRRAINLKNNPVDTPLIGGEQLGINDRIITGDQSSAIIEFKDGSRVLIHDNTELLLKRVEQYPDSNLLETELLLEQGRIETEVPEKSKGKSVFKIKTPSAMAAVRGTFLRTGAETDDSNTEMMQVEVLRGRVSVSGTKAEKTVTAGYGIVIEKGNPPGEVIPLLAAPELLKPAVFINRLSTLFTWKSITGSVGYRIQVFSEEPTPKLEWNTISKTNRISVPDLPDGQYTMKVRAIAMEGLEGKESSHQYVLDARPEPPLPASPAEDTNIESNDLIFRWSASRSATAYHLQLSALEDFGTPIMDKVFNEVEYLNELELKTGIYYWRIATQVEDQEGPFSDPQKFKIIPPAPQAMEPQGDDEHLIFRWQKGAPDLQYQMQLASDAEFNHVVLDKQLADPRLELDRPAEGRLYLRMRPIADNHFKGNWSNVQYVDAPANKPWYLLMLLPLLLLILLI